MTVNVRQVIVSATATTFPWFQMGTTSPFWTFTKNRLTGGGDCVVRLDFSLEAPGDTKIAIPISTFVNAQVSQSTAAVVAGAAGRFVVVSVSGNSSSYVFNFLQAGE